MPDTPPGRWRNRGGWAWSSLPDLPPPPPPPPPRAQIMKAKKKKIDKTSPDKLGVELRSHQKIISVAEPPKRKAGIMVESVDELVDKLRNEAKVIA